MRLSYLALPFVVVTGFAALAAQNIGRRATPAPLDQVKADVATLRDEVAALKQRVDRLEGQAPAAPQAAGAPNADPAAIAKAIQNKKVIAGMTFAEVQQIIGKPTEIVEQGERGDVYRWSVSSRTQVLENSPAPSDVGVYTLFIHFRDGKAVTFRRIEHAQGVPDVRR